MKKETWIIIAIIVVILALIGSCSTDEYTAQDLQDAKGRYFRGEATQEDKTMVEGFYKW